MTTRFRQVRNPDTGRKVWYWEIINRYARQLAGGYCATRADAENDAALALRSFALSTR